jgi:hypothetical protein
MNSCQLPAAGFRVTIPGFETVAKLVTGNRRPVIIFAALLIK